ncbi:MAG: manganese transport protein [Planctomycetota bacterium]
MSQITKEEMSRVRAGLRMAVEPDPEVLAAEKRELQRLDGVGFAERTRAYMRSIGPGYLQSAMTLGGGTAASSLFAGALFGYELLWVAPIAMLLGMIMLSAVSYQTLSTGLRPFDAMAKFAGKPLAWSWALGALFASIIWHFPQYALAAACLVDIGDVSGIEGLSASWMGFVVLAWALLLSLGYGRSPRLVRVYENTLKYIVWGIVVCFGIVVFQTGISDWGELFMGFIPHSIPGEVSNVAGITLVLAGLSAAVGINMVFLYPYSLLARGWGREHRRLARFDLVAGMFVPYVLAASLMLIAAANTLHLDPEYDGTKMSPVDFALSLSNTIGPVGGRVIFNLGVLGMALSSITAHMICAGFVGVELLGLEVGSWKHRLATMAPIPGVLGPMYWGDIAVYIAVPTSIICGLFLPLAYLGFIRLQGNRDYLGDDKPEGAAASLWRFGMIATTLFLSVFLGWYVYQKAPGFWASLTSAAS